MLLEKKSRRLILELVLLLVMLALLMVISKKETIFHAMIILLIYCSGLSILFGFVIMLIEKEEEKKEEEKSSIQWLIMISIISIIYIYIYNEEVLELIKNINIEGIMVLDKIGKEVYTDSNNIIRLIESIILLLLGMVSIFCIIK